MGRPGRGANQAWHHEPVVSSQLEWAVAGGLAGWAAARLTGADRLHRTEDWAAPLLSFTPQVAAGAIAAALALRGRGPRLTAALAAGVLTATVAPRALPRRARSADGPGLRVLTANLFISRVAADPLVQLVAATGTEVLFLQELTDDAVADLDRAGIARLLPHRVIEPVAQGPRGNGIYSRYPLRDERDSARTPLRSREYRHSAARPVCELALPSGGAVRLGCVHTRAPTPNRPQHAAARWRSQLIQLPAPGDLPLILAGDFNATLDHAHFRALLSRGYIDAARQVGHGLVMTWGPTPSSRALLALDHVVADSRCAVHATSVHQLPGTDHRAVYAELQLPR